MSNKKEIYLMGNKRLLFMIKEIHLMSNNILIFMIT